MVHQSVNESLPLPPSPPPCNAVKHFSESSSCDSGPMAQPFSQPGPSALSLPTLICRKSPSYGKRSCVSVPEGRRRVATGASPWQTFGTSLSPAGATGIRGAATRVPAVPLGLSNRMIALESCAGAVSGVFRLSGPSMTKSGADQFSRMAPASRAVMAASSSWVWDRANWFSPGVSGGGFSVIAGLPERYECAYSSAWHLNKRPHQILMQFFNSCPFVSIRGPATRFLNHEWTRMDTKFIEELPRHHRTSASLRVCEDRGHTSHDGVVP
jgi:hypothetical protein